jgi:peptide/nickel transport system substrate-binding protein
MKADFVAADWGTVVARRSQKSPPGQGGWHMFHASHSGSVGLNPATNYPIRANGDGAWFGWPSSPEVEAEVAAWYEAKTLDDEKAIVRQLNRAALDHVVYAPVGAFLHHHAWRKNLTGIVQGPMPFFWGVSKTA